MEEKIFFSPGDIVTIKQNIENKPEMIVVKKETFLIKLKDTDKHETMFKGIRCRWFSNNKELHEAVFSTKDLKQLIKE